jgi:hypothetical protein
VYILHSRAISQAVHTHTHTIRTYTIRTPICTVVASYSLTAILTLFAHYSHGRTLFAPSHTIRTPFAHYSHVAHYSVFAWSHTIRTLYSHGRTLFSHYSRGSHTIRAIVNPNSHTVRTSSHPGHTIRAVGASPFAVFALMHTVFAQLTPVRICECVICTL